MLGPTVSLAPLSLVGVAVAAGLADEGAANGWALAPLADPSELVPPSEELVPRGGVVGAGSSRLPKNGPCSAMLSPCDNLLILTACVTSCTNKTKES